MTTSGARVVFRPVAIAIGLFAAALLASACGSSSGHPASAPAPVVSSTTQAPTTTTTTLAKPNPFDPTKPIDLGGTPGVTPAEQHRAEQLLRATIVDLK